MSADKKTRERTEGAATAVQAKHAGDSFSAKRVQAGPFSSTSVGVKAEPPALPCRDDVLVDSGAAASKSCLSPLEMRTPTVTGGSFPAGTASTATRTTFDQPPFRFFSAEETNSKKTSIQYAWYYSSFWRNYLIAVPSCRRVIETKTGQNLIFNPGGFTGRLRACPFVRMWRALLCGEVFRLGSWWYPRVQCFLAEEDPQNTISRSEVRATRTYCGRSLFSPQLGWFECAMPGYGRGEQMPGSVMERGA